MTSSASHLTVFQQEVKKNLESPARLQVKTFAKCPRLSFSKVKVGKSRTVDLLIENPNDFPVSLTTDQFSVESDLEILVTQDIWINNDKTIIIILSEKSFKTIKCKWSPTKVGKMRQTMCFRWDDGHKLQAILLGNAEQDGLAKIKSNKIFKTPHSAHPLQENKPFLIPSEVDNVLTNIQLDTSIRRSTFTVDSNSPIKRVVKKVNMGSLSPLSFDKCNSVQKENKDPLQFGGVKKISLNDINHGKNENIFDIKQEKNSIKTSSTKRNLFSGKTASEEVQPKHSRYLKTASEEVQPKHSSYLKTASEEVQPKHSSYLKRQSVSRALPIKPVQGLAVRKLKLSTSTKVNLPRHPIPYAAKNMCYDERWIDKQERGFANWLNFILTPDNNDVEEEENERRGTYIIDSSKRQPVAPSREDISFKVYSLRHKMVRLRRAGCLLYQSDEFSWIIQKIEREIECEMLAVRTDRRIEADIGIKNKIRDMILSYNSLWLRIGLEVIYGEIILLHSNNDVFNLSKFIMSRMLANPLISKQYSHATIPNLYKPGYEEVLHKFILKKFLLLVIFLDRAKQNRLIEHDPCLFVKNSEFKSSRDLLLTFSREYLKGEGDITKHLSYMGIVVQHQQSVIDEYDFGLKNLAVDLRDGVRLVRVVELLTKDWSHLPKLRVPAVSRLQKIHNVGIALSVLKDHGLNLSIDPKSVVDGHREKTLMVLWQIIFHFEVGLLLDTEKLKEEIEYQKKNLQFRKELATFPNPENLSQVHEELSLSDEVYFKSEKLSLLLNWCKVICAHYDVKVENFTVSFSDGIAFCCLINFYHPDILPQSLINHETTLTRNISLHEEEVADNFFYENWTKCFSPNTGVNRTLEMLLMNEKANYRVLNQAIQDLGGIPSMLRCSDMSNTIPDEKVVVTYISYLCARLLNIREEAQAARKIQLTWRRYSLKKQHSLLKVYESAAQKIQLWYRYYHKKYLANHHNHAAVTIQRFWRNYKQRCSYLLEYQNRLEEQAAIIIQSFVRCFLARLDYLFLRGCIILCQSVVRRWLVRKDMKMKKKAVSVIQSCYRGYKITCCLRYKFLQQRSSAVIIQRAFRYHKCRVQSKLKYFELIKRAAIIVQSHYKGFLCRRQYKNLKLATILIQRLVRVKIKRREFLKLKSAVSTIENFYVACIKRRCAQMKYCSLRNAALKIQQQWRHFLISRAMRYRYLQMKSASILIQSWVKMKQAQRIFLKIKKSALIIENAWVSLQQGRNARREYMKMYEAIKTIQFYYRGYKLKKKIKAVQVIENFWLNIQKVHLEHNQFLLKRASCVKIQAAWRSYQIKKEFLQLKHSVHVIECRYKATLLMRLEKRNFKYIVKSVVLIQAWFRCHSICRSFQKKKSVCIFLQKVWRMHLAKKHAQKEYHKKKHAIVMLQSHIKKFLVMKEFSRKKNAVIIIQSSFRMYQCRKKYKQYLYAVVCIQANIRRYLASLKFNKKKLAATKIQATIKMFICLQNYSKIKNAVQIIQRSMRVAIWRRQYKQKRNAAIKIQSFIRMVISKRQFHKQMVAIIKVQALVRRYLCQQLFLKNRTAVITIQTYFRMTQQKKIYLLQLKSAVTIQSHYRSFKARKNFTLLKISILKIQSFYRMALCKYRYKVQRRSAVILQSYIRMYFQQKKYLKLYQAIIQTQSKWRMQKERKFYLNLKESAMKIQAFFRGYRERYLYNSLKSNVIIIQSYVRMYIARKEYVRKQKALFLIQCTCKMFVVRKEFLRKKSSALKIQSVFRKHKCYVQLTNAAIIIQKMFKGMVQRKRFLQQKQAAIVLQTFFRGMIQRKKYIQQRHNIIHLQSVIRMFLQKKLFKEQLRAINKIKSWLKVCYARRYMHNLIYSCILIQSFYRMHLVRKVFVLQKKSVVVIQSAFRSHRCRTKYLCIKSVAVKIQANYRMHKCISEYKRIRFAVIKLQAFTRMIISRNKFVKLQNVVIKLQSWWRMCYWRHAFLKHKSAAIKIQSVYHRFAFKKRYLQKINSILKIQAFLKMCLARIHYLNKHQAVLKIQSSYRAYQHRKLCTLREKAACIIQSTYRMHRVKVQFLKIRHSVQVIQTYYRMYSTKKRYLKMKSSALTIQSYYRKWKAEKMREELITKNCVTIQRWWCHKREIMHQKNATIVLQSFFRMYLKRQSYLRRLRAIIIIQCWYKTIVQRRKYLKTVLYLQKTLRKNALCRAQRAEYLAIRKSVILIQSHIRKMLALKSYSKIHDSVCLIQRIWRIHIQDKKNRIDLICKEEVLQIIQSSYDYWHKRREASIKISSFMKMFVTQKKYHQIQNSVLCIQKAWRMFAMRSKHKRKKKAVELIETWYKVMLKNKNKKIKDAQHYELIEKSAVTIQRVYRRYCFCKSIFSNLKSFLILHRAALKLQKFFRNTHISRQQRNNYLKLKSAVIVLQHAFRKKSAEKKLHIMKQATSEIENWNLLYNQKTTEQRCEKQREIILGHFIRASLLCLSLLKIQRWIRKEMKNKKERSALIIQSYWRGFKVRSCIKDRNLKEAAARISIATNKLTEPMRLCNRTKSALEYLLHVKNLSTVIDALQSLDLATSVSFRCCEQLLKDEAINVIYKIIKFSNRSLPWVSIKEVAFKILLNLAKCPTTYRAVYDHKQSVSIILEQMSIYREKKCLIFSKGCNLLTILCHDDHIKSDIKIEDETSKKIISFYSLLKRKRELEVQRQIQKDKMIDKKLCNAKAKWHRRTSAVNAEDPLIAIRMLINVLEIDVKV